MMSGFWDMPIFWADVLPIQRVTDSPGPGGSPAGIQTRLGSPRIDPPFV